nr:2-oxoisovalerate dehydrogenase subunit alpha 1, mitochondrial-like isoform X2 [Ipomoea batatas]
MHLLQAATSTHFSLHRFKSTGAVAERSLVFNENDDVSFPTLDFPGGKVPFTTQMKFISAATDRRIPCYRVLNDDGYVLLGSSVFEQVELAS